jgi:hypothetical protein
MTPATDRAAGVLQNTRIHQESAEHALKVKDIDHWCLAAVVNVDSPRLLAAIEAVLELHQPLDRGTGAQCQGCATHVTFTRWPCPTYEAISAALLGPQQGETPGA